VNVPSGSNDVPHLPRLAPIESFGKGGFRFAGMSHRGSLLCLPSGIWAWPVVRAEEVNEKSLTAVFNAAAEIGLFLIGAGHAPWIMPAPLHAWFHTLKISVEVMRTGTAVSTYNILLGEGRRVAAGFIAVD
jgi:uncharacterized protein